MGNYGKVNELYRNDGGGNFTRIINTAVIAGGGTNTNALAWGDIDGDGDLVRLPSAANVELLYASAAQRACISPRPHRT